MLSFLTRRGPQIVPGQRHGITRTRDLGRVGIGLGLMLIALWHLLFMIFPFEDAPSLRLLLSAVTTDPLIDILLAAGLTWAAHSSVAVVLLIMAFAAQAVVPPHAAFTLVLGANLGTALNPLLESGVGGDPAAIRGYVKRMIAIPFELVIFDCDGVLVDNEPIINRAHADVLTACGYPSTERDLVERFCGMSDAEMLALVERERGRALPLSYTERVGVMIENGFCQSSGAIEGVAEALDELRLPVCLASSSAPSRSVASSS